MTTSTGPDVVWGFEQHDQSGEPTGLVFEPVPFQYNKGGGEHVQAPQYRRVMEVKEATSITDDVRERRNYVNFIDATRETMVCLDGDYCADDLEAIATLLRVGQEVSDG